MSRIIFLRHAESETNAVGAFGDYKSSITELGKKQAKIAGKFLKDNYNISNIVYSPLVRTEETMKYVNDILKIKNPIELDLLKERDNGLLSGIKAPDIKNIPNVGVRIDNYIKKAEKLSFIDVTKGKYDIVSDKIALLSKGETDKEFTTRVKKAIKYIKGLKTKGDILVISHGSFIKNVIYIMFKISPIGMGNKYGKYDNCNISTVNVDTGELELQLYSKYLD